MKTLLDFIAEKHQFLVKGHTKDQSGAVDLGLPSGTKWAPCNIGATNPEDSGDFYSWGETSPKKEYTHKTYKFKKKVNDLEQEDDVAYKTTNGKFRMPTDKELNELIRNTDNIITELNGVKGIKFISKQSSKNSIFVPFAGYMHANSKLEHKNRVAFLLSSHKDEVDFDWPTYLMVDKDRMKILRMNAESFDGFSVRGVLNK